jgi:hypothetical protein
MIEIGEMEFEENPMRRIRILRILCLVFFLGKSLCEEERPLASEELIRGLTDEVSGEIAHRYTGWIANYDRIQSSEGWHEAAALILKELKSIGYKEAVEAFKLRGYQGYEALNFIDGKRSVLDISLDVSAEYGLVKVEDVGYYFKLLAKAGLLTLNK